MGKHTKSKLKTTETVFNPPVPTVNVFEGLEDREISFISTVTLDYTADVCSGRGHSSSGGKDRHDKTSSGGSGGKGGTSGCISAAHLAFVGRAESILEEHNMIIIKNALSAAEVATLHAEYVSLHSLQGTQQAIGEKDASKRSGTRMYNCQCQLGPKCTFKDWKKGATGTRAVLAPPPRFGTTTTTATAATATSSSSSSAGVWVDICRRFHLEHVARVEVVTSHVGCRAQGWHIDGVHGLTVIFPLTHVGLRQGQHMCLCLCLCVSMYVRASFSRYLPLTPTL